MMQAKRCDPISDDESLFLVWDDERAAKFAASEKKKYAKGHKQGEKVCQ
jgi:hypothetical protein